MMNNNILDAVNISQSTFDHILSLGFAERRIVLKELGDISIFQSMINQQYINRFNNTTFQSKKYRIKILFGIIQKIATILELSLDTFCLSVHIFDALISKIDLSNNLLLPISLVSLTIASKIKENQQQVLNYSFINSYIYSYGVNLFKKLEIFILDTIGFKANLIIPKNFINFILKKFFKNDLLFFGSENVSEITKNQLLKIISVIHLITLVDFKFYKFSSFAVGLSVIIFSRIIYGLEPLPENIKTFIGVGIDDLKECLKLIYLNYSNDYLNTIFETIEHDSDTNDDSDSHDDLLLGQSLNDFSSFGDNCIQFFLNENFQLVNSAEINIETS